jgi:hypothetical protein
MTAFRLHFDTRTMDPHFAGVWAARMAAWTVPAEMQLVAGPAEADAILDLSAHHFLGGGRSFTVHPSSHYHRWPDRTFDWDSTDFPSGRMPGLYCSLSRQQHDPARHRGFCYPWRHNAAVNLRPRSEAGILYGFSGSVSSGLRARMLAALARNAGADQLIRETGSMWDRMFSGGDDPAKTRYADDLARCQFILCPRGNGLSSIRIYEAMETGRVPVILSDRLALPECIDWSACAVQIAERDLDRIPQLLAERAADWPALARSARAQWENRFSDGRMLATLLEECQTLLDRRRHARRGAAWFIPLRILPSWLQFQAQAGRRKLQQAVRRSA